MQLHPCVKLSTFLILLGWRMSSILDLCSEICLFFYEGTVAPTMLVGSKPAITVVQGPFQCSRSKSIDFTIALCCDHVCSCSVQLVYAPTDKQIADILTRQLGTGPYILYHGRFMILLPFLRT